MVYNQIRVVDDLDKINKSLSYITEKTFLHDFLTNSEANASEFARKSCKRCYLVRTPMCLQRVKY